MTMFIDLGEYQLQPMQTAWATELCRWANDPMVTHYLFTGRLPSTVEDWTDTIREDMKDSSCVVLGIIFTDGRHLVGTVGFYQIDPIGRTAEYRIFIGDRRHWGKGLGSAVTKAMVAYGFGNLNLHTIWLGVNADHIAAQRAYANAGFEYEGTLRDRIYRNGQYYDAIAMSVLRSEVCFKRESSDLDGLVSALSPILTEGSPQHM